MTTVSNYVTKVYLGDEIITLVTFITCDDITTKPCIAIWEALRMIEVQLCCIFHEVSRDPIQSGSINVRNGDYTSFFERCATFIVYRVCRLNYLIAPVMVIIRGCSDGALVIFVPKAISSRSINLGGWDLHREGLGTKKFGILLKQSKGNGGLGISAGTRDF